MNIKQSLLHARINQLHKRLKHKIGMHDQREHGNWSKGPGMYGGEVYVPTGRRAEFLANRSSMSMNTLATIAQEETLFNITQRLPPKAKTGVPSQFAPMPIDASEFEPGGFIYEQFYTSDEKLNIEHISNFIMWGLGNAESLLKIQNFLKYPKHITYDPDMQPILSDIKDSINNINIDENQLMNMSDEEISTFASNIVDTRYTDDKYIIDLVKSAQIDLKDIQEKINQVIRAEVVYNDTKERLSKLGINFPFNFSMFENKELQFMDIAHLIFNDESNNNVIQEKNIQERQQFKDVIIKQIQEYGKYKTLPAEEEINKFVDAFVSELEYFQSNYQMFFSTRISSINQRMIKFLDSQNMSLVDSDFFELIINSHSDIEEFLFNTFTNRISNAISTAMYTVDNSIRSRKYYLQDKDRTYKRLKNGIYGYILSNFTSNEYEFSSPDNKISEYPFDFWMKSMIDDSGDEEAYVMQQAYEVHGIQQIVNNDMLTHFFQNESPQSIVDVINNEIQKKKNRNKNLLTIASKFPNIINKELQEQLKKIINERFKLIEDVKISANIEDATNELPADIKNVIQQQVFAKSNLLFSKDKFKIQKALGIIYDAQSYNGKPEIMDWNNIINPTTPVQIDTQGMPLVFFRSNKGISDTDPEQIDRGLEYVEQMRTGDVHYPGTGVSGYGTYMKTSNIYGVNRAEKRVSSALYLDTTDPVELEQWQVALDEHEQQLYRIADELESILPQLNVQSLYGNTVNDEVRSFLNGVAAVKDMIQKSPEKNTFTYYNALQSAFTGGTNTGRIDVEPIIDSLNTDVKLDDNPNVFQFIDLVNQISNLHMPESDYMSNFYPVYERAETLASDANATRALYGGYTTAYTVNSDARMPPGFVNGSNNGNIYHTPIISLDQYINKEISTRYPKLMPENMNIGVKMAILGYDAYYPHLNDHSTNVVVLNRAILNVANSTLTGDESPEDIRNFINKFAQPSE